MNLLVVSPQNTYAIKRLQKEAGDLGIELSAVTAAELSGMDISAVIPKYDALYVRQEYSLSDKVFGPEDLLPVSLLAKSFFDSKKIVVDESIVHGDIGRGKYPAHKRLDAAGILNPKTILWSGSLKNNLLGLKFPLVVKWNFGFGGKHVFLVDTEAEIAIIAKRHQPDELLVQEYIQAEFEYKVITVSYKSLPVIIRMKARSKSFLLDSGSAEILSADNFPEIVSLAENAARVLGRELAKTDILQTAGKLYVLEVNRRPGFQHFEQITGWNVAREFLKYIKNRGIKR